VERIDEYRGPVGDELCIIIHPVKVLGSGVKRSTSHGYKYWAWLLH
jgi:hypothetical protein